MSSIFEKFCPTCKDVIIDKTEAKFCHECGTKLISLELLEEKINTDTLSIFLKDVLGYEVVEVYDEDIIEAQFTKDKRKQNNGIITFVIKDFDIEMYVDLELSKNVSQEIGFFKALNKANDTFPLQFCYIEPESNESITEEDKPDYGMIRASHHILPTPKIATVSLYHMAKGRISAIRNELIRVGLAEYLGWIVFIDSFQPK